MVRILLVVMAAALLAAAGIAQAATINVPADYGTVQAAVDAAVATDTILVAAGTYNEHVTVNKALTLRGSGAIVDGGGSGACFTLLSSDITLDGFEIRNAEGGVVVYASTAFQNVKITDNVVHDISDPTHGFGVYVGYQSEAFYTPPVGDPLTDHLDYSGLEIKGNTIYNTSNAGLVLQSIKASSGLLEVRCNSIHDASASGIWIDSARDILLEGNTLADCVTGVFISGYASGYYEGNPNDPYDPQNILVYLNTITGNDGGIKVYDGWPAEMHFNYNKIYGNLSVDVYKYSALEPSAALDATKNWWGTGIGGGMFSGNLDYTDHLATPAVNAYFAGARLVDLQNDDGGWDWPLDDGDSGNASPLNTVGPIAKGLAMAYWATSDADMLLALQQAGVLLLSKTNNFSPSDGYLAAELDKVFAVTTYTDHVTANYYGPLAAGTYDKNGAGTPYGTAAYVDLIRANRDSQGIANLAAWDVAMGLVGALACGADTSAWIAGTKAEINELDGSASYDVIGLAGAVYGLALAGEDFDPTAGEHAAASSLADLAAILAGYQLNTGGFTWNSDYYIEDDDNETIQETAYAALALDAVGGYSNNVTAALCYIKCVQLETGGWKNWAGGGENNEITGEGEWANSLGNKLYLNVDGTSLYVQPGEPVYVTLAQTNLLEEAVGYQAFLSFDDAKMSITASDIALESTPYGQGILKTVSGADIDLAAGINYLSSPPQDPTTDSADLADLTFTAGAGDYTTQVVFRVHDPTSRLTDDGGYEIATNTVDSQTIVIDGTPPVITCPGDVVADNDTGLCSASLDPGAATATDNLAGVESIVGTRSDSLDLVSDPYPVGITTITWVATDKAGNTSSCVQTITVNDTELPTITAPDDVTVNADAGQCYATGVALGSATTGDNCGVASVDNDAPTQFPVGDTTVTWTVTDVNGNVATDTQVVTVVDNQPPTITAPADVSVFTDPGVCYATGVALGSAVVDDNCGIKAGSPTNDAPAQFPKGDTTVTWTVEDIHGNTATDTQVVTVVDNQDPTITAPADIVQDTDGGVCYATIADLGTPVFGDNCPGATVDNDAPANDQYAKGITVVTWTVTDAAGRTATDTQTITVNDAEAPDVTAGTIDACYPDVASAEAAAIAATTATDNCDVPVLSAVTLGTCKATILVTAADSSGNSSSTTYYTRIDGQDPVITCPADITEYCPAGETEKTIAVGTATATDNCNGTYLDGFEESNWVPGVTWIPYESDITRTASGTGGIASKSGGYHGVITPPAASFSGVFSRLGGYSTSFNGGFTVRQDVYIDLTDPAIAANTYGWDLTCAANRQDNSHLRDFIFHAAAYSAAPGHVLIGGSNNSNFAPRHDLHAINHYEITSSGWYTFEWVFRDDGAGALAVDLILRDAAGTQLWVETSSDAADLISTIVGGNRYMWFTFVDTDALAIDNTTLIPSQLSEPTVVGVRSDAKPLSDPYPIGVTTITWTATDDCGNSSDCVQTITVLNKNQASILVGYENVDANKTRDIEFQFGGDGSGGNTYTTVVTVTFDANPKTVVVDIDPAAVAWTCVSAKDLQHTLRSTVTLTDSGDTYSASFTDADKLIGGDLTNDNLVDILDFGVFAGQFSTKYDGPYAWPLRDADIDGNGSVWSEDFSYIQSHFLDTGDDICAGAAAVSSEPRSSVIIYELASYEGYNTALAADLNHDRWVDEKDVKLFIARYINGSRSR